MALSGSLSEFSVAEILQLLALQQKSGVLVLTYTDGGKHVLFFERGRILAAADRRRESRHPFLQYLFENLHLTRDQVESVGDIATETGQDLFTVILTTGIMGRDRLGDEMHRYTQRLIDDVVGWKEGTYEFSGDEKSLPHQGLPLKLSAEELLMESMRRNDELSTLKDSLISPNLVLAKSPSSPGAALPRECSVVLKLVDGMRTVEEVCRISPMGDFLTYDAITELLGRQQVIVMDSDQAARLNRRRTLRLRMSPVAWAWILGPLVGSVLLGNLIGPLLQRSAEENRGVIPAEITQRREALREELRAEFVQLGHDSGR